MDQQRIGKFIAECRKEQGFTQMQLAEKLNITDRAISKWENGKAMPDSSLMLELCRLLQISVNDLLSGEKLSEENYSRKTEEKLLEIIREKQRTDSLLLFLATFFGLIIGIFAIFILLLSEPSVVASRLTSVILFVVGIVLFVCGFVVTRAQQIAGYHRCLTCGHTYTPSFWGMCFSFGSWKKHNLRCPKCKKQTWHQSVFSKE